MRYDDFQRLRLNPKGDTPCVIIRTGEIGVILQLDKPHDKIMVKAKRHGHVGYQEEWFNYIEVETW